MKESADNLSNLIEAAKQAKRFAQAHYSGFCVGAALETKAGRIFTGVNVESSSYGLTICAERVALVKALSEGFTDFTRLVVLTDGKRPTPPCGACRQLLWDYARNLEIILVDKHDAIVQTSIAELFPQPFGAEDL
ncbi:MAG: cytidine deaminase [bacterium]